MIEIKIEPISEKEGAGIFNVEIIEAGAKTSHVVEVGAADRRLASGRLEPAVLVRRSFEFLLAREPKESILPRFKLTDIPRYYPEYEREMAEL